jgi:hypothetical protein
MGSKLHSWTSHPLLLVTRPPVARLRLRTCVRSGERVREGKGGAAMTSRISCGGVRYTPSSERPAAAVEPTPPPPPPLPVRYTATAEHHRRRRTAGQRGSTGSADRRAFAKLNPRTSMSVHAAKQMEVPFAAVAAAPLVRRLPYAARYPGQQPPEVPHAGPDLSHDGGRRHHDCARAHGTRKS